VLSLTLGTEITAGKPPAKRLLYSESSGQIDDSCRKQQSNEEATWQ
jgi:hypothetical protein